MASSNNTFLLQDVLLFTGDEFIDNGYVFVKNGQIDQVGRVQDLSLELDVTVISKPGHTIAPGLIDAHLHGLGGNVLCLEQNLKFGVTTVCDLHNEVGDIAKLKGLANDPDKKDIYADFKCAGLGATIHGGWPEAALLAHFPSPQTTAAINSWPRVLKPEDAMPFVKHQIETNGASFIKMFHERGTTIGFAKLPEPLPEVHRAVVEAAHAHGLVTIGHAYDYKGAMALLSSGVDGLAHIFLDKAPDDAFVKQTLKNKGFCCPTLSTCTAKYPVGFGLQTAFAADPLSVEMLSNKTVQEPVSKGAAHTKIEDAYESVKALYDAGVPIIAGSDASGLSRGVAYGMSVHFEMWLMTHRVKMQTIDVLKAATSKTADIYGFHDRGRISKGKKADLIIIEGDVRNIMADETKLCLPVRGVWRDGVLSAVWEGRV